MVNRLDYKEVKENVQALQCFFGNTMFTGYVQLLMGYFCFCLGSSKNPQVNPKWHLATNFSTTSFPLLSGHMRCLFCHSNGRSFLSYYGLKLTAH